MTTKIDYKKRYREKNREKINAKAREQYAKFSDNKKKSQKLYLASPEGQINRRYVHVKHRYGLSREQYDSLVLEYNNQCGICGASSPDKPGFLCVDHDHSTGKIRGLLCRICNSALGKFKDSPVILSNAITYLNKYGK